ncbi:LOW QUALITY PROTEIN: melanoma-associated antigen B16-like [Suricata suricatta]|uniref:LOW QUALITY PROTEIN: melanoma-associated antigen B16-like n=1 Tax=Suricata suricatta TaxID=37032 RepID=UPI0011553B34|nr:LOW QUALITY PROTEIN: melanoma-associated antigen B16-like [Suricata suricatta]
MGEVLAAGIPSTPQSPQSSYSSHTVITAISPSKSDESSTSQEKEDSSASSSKVLSDTENLPVDPLDENVTLLVQFLLHNYQMKEPITKGDVIDVVIQESKDNFLEILRRASEHMELDFGVDMKKVDPTGNGYALVNKLGLTNDVRLHGKENMSKTSLLITVLSVICMKGNYATEEIWNVVNLMDLYSGRKHSIFGEPRKFIMKNLVREKYLDYHQVPNSDPPYYEFLHGRRAHTETSKMKLLEFLIKIHESDARCFPFQQEKVLTDEAERA